MGRRSRTALPALIDLDEEKQVIAKLQNGDLEAYATLHGWYADRIYRFVIWPRLPVQELAEDCLRETMKTALEKIDQFKTHERSVFFWLRRIAIHKATDIHRRAQRDQKLKERLGAHLPLHPAAAPDAPDRRRDLADLEREVGTTLGRINPRYAQALRMRLLEERTREACAEALDVSVATFDVLFHRAAKAFRKGYPP